MRRAQITQSVNGLLSLSADGRLCVEDSHILFALFMNGSECAGDGKALRTSGVDGNVIELRLRGDALKDIDAAQLTKSIERRRTTEPFSFESVRG